MFKRCTYFGYCKLCSRVVIYDYFRFYLPKKSLICRKCENLIQIIKTVIKH